jgi:hypothetical protein
VARGEGSHSARAGMLPGTGMSGFSFVGKGWIEGPQFGISVCARVGARVVYLLEFHF